MRHRTGSDDDAAPVEDPLAIFETPSKEEKEKSSNIPLIVQICCSRRNLRYWLCYIWLLIIVVMTTITCKVFSQVFGTLPTSPADSFLSLFFPTAWKWKRNRNRKKTVKTILYYNNYWNFPHFQFGEHHRPFVDANCPVHDCVAVQNRPTFSDDYKSTFDAVLIHTPEWTPEVISWRRPNQRFIDMNMESPLSYNAPRFPDSFFNWTMTYRLDSDLPRPYGFFEPTLPVFNKQQSANYQPIQWQHQEFLPYKQDWLFKVLPKKGKDFHQLAQRPKKVAWIVSRCDSPSRREDYVKELQKYIQVDILGGCGGQPCNTTFPSQPDNCTAAVERDYKFYLAFENSFCQDYVTEKFFHRMAGNSLVIVLGGANYSRIAPPHSHFNALEYDSPKALAETLYRLDQNNALYLSYFWWKDYYKVHTGTAQDHASTMCKLCKMLHDPSLPSKVYPASWSSAKRQCSSDLPTAIQKVAKQVVPDDDGKLLDD